MSSEFTARALARFIASTLALLMVACSQGSTSAPRTSTEHTSTPEAFVDLAMVHWPKQYPPPKSAWISKQSLAHRELLGKGTFDVLVLPFQVTGFGLSKSTRSLMGAKLAMAIAETGSKVADPYLVSRALGEGFRQFETAIVHDLANRVKASRLIQGFVGHDQLGNLRLVIHVAQSDDGKWRQDQVQPAQDIEMNHIPFAFDSAAIEAFDTRLAEIMELLGYDWSGPRRVNSQSITELPSSPLPSEVGTNPAYHAYHLQLLGALTASRSERAREELFEKSLLAIERINGDPGAKRLLTARAYMNLGLRPAALALLASPKTPGERALVAALNGNLTVMKSVYPNITSPVERLFALVDMNRLNTAYDLYARANALADAELLEIPEPWHGFVERHFSDADVWNNPSNRTIKQILDEEFPTGGFDLDALQRGALALGQIEAGAFDIELSVSRHIDQLMQHSPELWCCESFDSRPHPRDYLALLESNAIDNLVRQAHLRTRIQGRPDSALEYLDATDEIFYEHPAFALQRGLALHWKAQQEKDFNAPIWREAFKNAANAFFWEQGQTVLASHALFILERVPRQVRTDYGPIDSVYSADLPYRPGYSLRRVGQRGQPRKRLNEDEVLDRYIAYSMTNFDFFKREHLAANKWSHVDRIERIRNVLMTRFQGSPDRFLLLAEVSRKEGDEQSADSQLRQGIEAAPRHWPLYRTLGEALFQRGEIDVASELFNSYPPFADENLNRVQLSNEAYQAGSHLYWRGRLDNARQYYDLSANLQTGSEASLTSATRIALMESDYLGAVSGSLRQASRYNDRDGYRDYLGLLFMLGQDEDAWAGFDVLAPQQETLRMWDAALAGHRRGNYADTDIIAWTGEPTDSVRDNAFASRYLVRAAVTDRLPSDLIIDAVTARSERFWMPKGVVDPSHLLVEIPTGQRRALSRPPDADLNGLFEVKPHSIYLLELYRAAHEREFVEAWQLVDESIRYHGVSLVNYMHGFILPYYALIGMQNDKREEVQAVLKLADDLEGKGNLRFDYWLARAIEHGLSDEKSDALVALDMAMGNRPTTGHWAANRIMDPAYEYADVCEWLWRETGDEEYRQHALKWVRVNQLILPWASWTYTMEATLTNDAEDRRAAIDKGFFLDPNSARLATLPEVDRARASTADNPFVRGLVDDDEGIRL